ncbi:MAG: hypothetical protein PWP21_1570 [Thermosediminibacterales bacterium]|jgi:GT2 family glycosyltransferase|nr:hypothetical protein [Thermosediminibacterales bacterium]
MEVAIIILNWNRSDLTIRSIINLKKIESSIPYKIVIVDNKSEDPEREKMIKFSLNQKWVVVSEAEMHNINIITEHGKAARGILLLNSKNSGYAIGNNIGLRLVKKLGYQKAVIMNNDVILEKPVIENLLNLMETDPQIAVIGPKIIGPNGRQQGPFNKPNLYDYFFYPLFYPFLYPINKIVSKIKWEGNISYPYRISGCFMIVDLKALEEVEWFDEKTFLYAEELILSEKLSRKGYKVAFSNSCYVKHIHEATTKSLGKTRKLIQLKSDLYYFREYRGYGSVRLFLIKIGLLYKEFVLLPVLEKITKLLGVIK